MRRIVRPFIREFKTYSSKSAAAARPLRNGGEGHTQPPSSDKSAVEARSRKDKDSYKAALEAADAVFGPRDFVAAPCEDQAATPVGRVLPSLIEQNDPLSIRLKAAEKTRPSRKAGKAKTASPVKRKKLSRPPQVKAARPPVFEQPIAALAQDEDVVSASRREVRPIQERWVFKTQLKPGEKWKRRLCKAAR